MEETENKPSQVSEDEKIYSQAEIDKLKSELQAEFQSGRDEIKKELEAEMQKSGMSELELVKLELDEMKKKYQKKEDECLMAAEKEEALQLLREADISPSILDLVYEFKDKAKTKANIQLLKEFLEIQKKEIIQKYIDVPNIEISKQNEGYDPFIDGFDTNTL